MKIIVSFLIIAFTSVCSVYDWKVKTVERDSDFSDELQNDYLKNSGHENLYYTNLRKPHDLKDNEIDMNKQIQDYKYNLQNKGEDKGKIERISLNRDKENKDPNYYGKPKKPTGFDNELQNHLFSHNNEKSEEFKDINYNQRQHKNRRHYFNDNNEDTNVNRNNRFPHHSSNNNDENFNNENEEVISNDKKHPTDNEDNNNFYNNKANSFETNQIKSDYENLKIDFIGNHNFTDHKHHNIDDSDSYNLFDYNNHKQHNNDNKNAKKEYITDENQIINNDNKVKEDCAVKSHWSAKGLDIENFVGTNLFDSMSEECFSTEELALLSIRRDFESFIPKDLPQCLLNDRMIAVLSNYFYFCHRLITRMTLDVSQNLAQKAFYDTLGGYLNFYLVPVTKYSYYGGHVTLNTVRNVLNLHQKCKKFLNTNGNGWKAPLQNVLNELKSIRIKPLQIDIEKGEQGDESSYCKRLDLSFEYNDDADDCEMIIPLPKLEAMDINGYLGNIWLPFKRKQTFDLRSDSAAYVVVKFYTTVTKCYLFEKIPQNCYNEKIKTWLLKNIHVHLSDEQFYPGLGAILRIHEYLKGDKQNITTYDDNLDDGDYEYENENRISKHKDKQQKHLSLKDMTKQQKSNDRNSEEFLNTPKRSREMQEQFKMSPDTQELVNKLSDNNDHYQDYSKKNSKNEEKEIVTKNVKISRKLVKQENPKENPIIDNIKLGASIKTADSTNPKTKFLELTPFQITVAITVAVVSFIILICCFKSCRKKKKENSPSQKPIKSTNRKNRLSSTSSLNLISSPSRFIYIQPNSESEESTASLDNVTEPLIQKVKKSVKIAKPKTGLDKIKLTDTSSSRSPLLREYRATSAKSRSKSSWETTFSSK